MYEQHEAVIRLCGGVTGRVWLHLCHTGSSYQRKISRDTGAALFGVQRALESLVNAGLISVTPVDNRLYYEIVRVSIEIVPLDASEHYVVDGEVL